jgi:transposase
VSGIRSWSTRQELVHQVVTLARQGLSIRAIARSTGVSRNTVKTIITHHAAQREQEHSALDKPPSRVPRPRKIDGFVDQVAALLNKYSDITSQRMFETLRDEHGFDGCYTSVKNYLRKIRPKPKPAASLIAPDHGPGGMAESDWSPYQIPLLSGGVLDVQAFGYALRHSTRKAYYLFESNDLHALMDGHVCTFGRFNGCAKACIYDSQKPVVLRWEGHQPIYNPRFLAFAAHYEFQLEAVRGNPNAKPRVERNFWEFERSFLNGRSFRDFDDLKAQLAHWLDHIVDQRRRHGRTPLERFADERDHLLPLPRHPYDTARVAYRLCSIDGFIDWAGNRYAVPYDHITDFLPVRITQHELFVYAANLQCVARHQLAPRGGGHKLDPHGYHPRPRRDPPADLDQLRAAFEHIGDGGRDFIRLVCCTPARHWSHHARRILLLRERYDTTDLDQALAHAAVYGAFDAQSVERILLARAKPRTLDEYVTEMTVRRLADRLGAVRTSPRDLAEYDRLPVTGVSPAPGASGAQQPETPKCPNATPQTPPATPPTPTTCSSSDCDDTSPSSD